MHLKCILSILLSQWITGQQNWNVQIRGLLSTYSSFAQQVEPCQPPVNIYCFVVLSSSKKGFGHLKVHKMVGGVGDFFAWYSFLCLRSSFAIRQKKGDHTHLEICMLPREEGKELGPTNTEGTNIRHGVGDVSCQGMKYHLPTVTSVLKSHFRMSLPL